jgi:hypothetical protein
MANIHARYIIGAHYRLSQARTSRREGATRWYLSRLTRAVERVRRVTLAAVYYMRVCDIIVILDLCHC